MNKFGAASLAAWFMVAIAVVLVAAVHETAAANCSPVELSPCLPAITGSAAPTGQCCSKLKEQQPCFCGYLKNPALKPYVDSPNARKVAAACHVAIPSC